MYEKDFPSINNAFIGFAAISDQDNNLVHLANIDYKKSFTVKKGVRVGLYTGHYVKVGSQYFEQIEFEAYLRDDAGVVHKFGFIDNDVYSTLKVDQRSDTDKMMSALIQNNKVILENNLLCAGLIDKLDVANVDIPDDYRRKLIALQTKLQNRDKHIAESVFFGTKQTATPQGFSMYNEQLTNFMNEPGIGIAPVVIYIIVSVVFGLLVSGIIYLLFKPDYTDSKADLVVSNDLAKALATLSPEARQGVIDDLNGQIDKAYVQGKLDGSGGGILKTLSYVAAGFLGFTVIDKYILNRDSK